MKNPIIQTAVCSFFLLAGTGCWNRTPVAAVPVATASVRGPEIHQALGVSERSNVDRIKGMIPLLDQIGDVHQTYHDLEHGDLNEFIYIHKYRAF